MKQKDFEKDLKERMTKLLEEYGCDRYLIFAGSKGKTGLLYRAENENDLVELIVLGIVENLKDKPESQGFLRTVILSAVTGDAYGSGWWDRLKKVVEDLDQRGQKWFGRA